MKQNCWEYMKCGRETGGTSVAEFGVCPAYTEKRLNAIHGGVNAGRACWIVAGTFCGGKPQGSFAEKEKTCLVCSFYKSVRTEEKERFRMSSELMPMLVA